MADSDGMPDPLRTTPGFDMVAATTFGSLAFLRDSLMEEIAVRTPGFPGSLHRRRGNRQIEESQRSLKGFKFPRRDRLA